MTISIKSCDNMNVIFPLVENLFREIIPGFECFCLDEKQSFLHSHAQGSGKYQSFIAYNEQDEAIGLLNVASSLSLFARGEYGIINELWVQSQYRSAGIGQKLLDAVCEHAKSVGWKRLDVAAPAGEQWIRTVNFYQRNDFVECGVKLRKWL